MQIFCRPSLAETSIGGAYKSMYAVVVTGGKQYKVQAGQVIEVEKLEGAVNDKVSLPVIMLSDGEKVLTGSGVSGKTVEAEIVAHGKAKKIIVYKYKAKKNIRKKQGHRQQFTSIKIGAIS